MSTMLVMQEQFNNMNIDDPTAIATTGADEVTTQLPDEVTTQQQQPSVLIVFANSDINAALYHLNKSLEEPFQPKAIATVLVQESIKNDFVEKLKQQLKPYPTGSVDSNKHFVETLNTAHKLSAQLITAKQKEANIFSPCFVFDFTHEQLGSTTPSGIIIFQTFRTAKEAIALVNKESLKFNSVSIWHENHSYAYELVAALKSAEYFINCYQVPLNVLTESVVQGKNYVNLDKSYHYETLQHDGVQKSIVFPIGSIFAN